MTAVDDFIENLAQNKTAPGVEPVHCNVDMFIAALGELRMGEPIGVTTFSASGDYVKNPNARRVKVELIGGAGGGASGRSGVAGSTRAGGGGGAAGSYACFTFDAVDLPASIPITIGNGGAGAAGSLGAVGSNGISGEPTLFGTLLFAEGGTRGVTTANSEGAVRTTVAFRQINQDNTATNVDTHPGQSGGGSSSFGLGGIKDGVRGGVPLFGMTPAGGGAGGGGISNTNVEANGGVGGGGWNATGNGLFQQTVPGGGDAVNRGGGGAAGAVPGGAGTAGATQVAPWFGSGGGGGSGSNTTDGGRGGDGGLPGGGGGGGGGCINTQTSGAGGNGARGEVRITEYY